MRIYANIVKIITHYFILIASETNKSQTVLR